MQGSGGRGGGFGGGRSSDVGQDPSPRVSLRPGRKMRKMGSSAGWSVYGLRLWSPKPHWAAEAAQNDKQKWIPLRGENSFCAVGSPGSTRLARSPGAWKGFSWARFRFFPFGFGVTGCWSWSVYREWVKSFMFPEVQLLVLSNICLSVSWITHLKGEEWF